MDQAFTSEETYAAIRRPVSVAETLPREAYTSDEFFAIERERVFMRGWVPIGCRDRLRDAGDVLVADVGGRSIVIARHPDGELRAFYNACRHRGTKLLDDGAGHVRRLIRCPYHSWTYDLDGQCVGTPLFTGSEIPAEQQPAFDMSEVEGFDRADYGLLRVAVESWGPLVFVNLDPDPGPLGAQLGDLPQRSAGYRLDDWQIASVGEYEIAANYKLIAENFMEYYHLPWVHPGLLKVSPIESHYRWQGPGMYTGFCTSPIASDTDDGGWQQGLPPIEGLDAVDGVSARFVWLFPNLALNILPNHLFVIHAQPVNPRFTRETTYLLTHSGSGDGEDAQQGVDQLVSFWDSVNREDIAIVERVQDGLDSTPFPGGRLCYRFEEPIHRFQNMIADRMVGIDRVPAGDDATTVPMF
jgi:choline monooxygenase